MKMKYELVEFIPENLENGVLYVSMNYGTVAHACCCGCGREVVTPLTPTDWSLTFDGETMSLYPSIGNWDFPCKSHYWIKKNNVEWAGQWSDRQIEDGRILDRKLKEEHYGQENVAVTENEPDSLPGNKKRKWWILRLLFGDKREK